MCTPPVHTYRQGCRSVVPPRGCSLHTAPLYFPYDLRCQASGDTVIGECTDYSALRLVAVPSKAYNLNLRSTTVGLRPAECTSGSTRNRHCHTTHTLSHIVCAVNRITHGNGWQRRGLSSGCACCAPRHFRSATSTARRKGLPCPRGGRLRARTGLRQMRVGAVPAGRGDGHRPGATR